MMKKLKEVQSLLQNKDGVWYQVFDLVRFVLICLAIVIPIRILIAQPFIVEGESMVPTFQDKNYLIVDQISYRLGHPERGDVIVFRYPSNPSRFFIKRVIGLPGETISFEGKVISIINESHPDGLLLEEPYISHSIYHDEETTLGEGEYYVMGDNRSNSLDSRSWGPLDESYITGRAWLRLWPLSKISGHPGDYRNEYETAIPAEENLEA